jgi:two-component system chemotaxis response regulator CheB
MTLASVEYNLIQAYSILYSGDRLAKLPREGFMLARIQSETMTGQENHGNHDLVVIGTSAGGVETLIQLVGQLPPDFPASICIVLHTAPDSPGFLADILDGRGYLQAKIPADGERLEHGVIYVAPPDRHLVVKPGHVHLTRGPHENRSRPSIDVLFRSAAVAYGSRVVALLLTGLLNDGVVGLSAVQRCGGVVLVQDPDSASYPDLPLNALRAIAVDHVLPLAEMGEALVTLVHKPVAQAGDVPKEIVAEARFAERNAGPAYGEVPLGETTMLSCPECKGPLQYITNGGVSHYRCHTGHAFTAESLSLAQDEGVEQALWSALRLLEEREMLLCQMAEQEQARGFISAAARFEERANEMRSHAVHLRGLIEQILAVS